MANTSKTIPVDNTDFIYKLRGNISDTFMNQFNAADFTGRMNFLKTSNIEIIFDKTATEIANNNLVMSGGKELPIILASMAKHFYRDIDSNSLFVKDCLDYLVNEDPAEYKIEHEASKTMYKVKIRNLLHDIAMGMKLEDEWDGNYNKIRSLIAHHTATRDQFADYLFSEVQLEKPDVTKQKDMIIYEKNGEFYLTLNLRLSASEQTEPDLAK